jgi:hypothetical protein
MRGENNEVIDLCRLARAIRFLSRALAGEWTTTSAVGEVQYTVTTQVLYVYRADAGNWTAGGCNAVTAQLGTSFPGVKEMLSLVMTARVTGTALKFFGDCNTSTGYFTAHSVGMP